MAQTTAKVEQIHIGKKGTAGVLYSAGLAVAG